MSCEQAEKEHAVALSAHAAAAKELKAYEDALFGSQSPPPILLSDADLEALERLGAVVRDAERTLQEKAGAYEEAKGQH